MAISAIARAIQRYHDHPSASQGAARQSTSAKLAKVAAIDDRSPTLAPIDVHLNLKSDLANPSRGVVSIKLSMGLGFPRSAAARERFVFVPWCQEAPASTETTSGSCTVPAKSSNMDGRGMAGARFPALIDTIGATWLGSYADSRGCGCFS